MLTIFLYAQIAVTPPPAAPTPFSEARAVIERQLASPPRTGTAAGMTAEEADAITAAYLASIGKKLLIEEPKSQ